MLDYIRNPETASSILGVSTNLLGASLAVAAIAYTLFAALAAGDGRSGDAVLRAQRLRRLVSRTILGAILEAAAMIAGLLWHTLASVLVCTSTVTVAIIVSVAGAAFLFTAAGVVFILFGLRGIAPET